MELIVKTGNKPITIKLREPTFDVYRMAIMAFQTLSGKGDQLAAGKIVLETCAIDSLENIKKDEIGTHKTEKEINNFIGNKN